MRSLLALICCAIFTLYSGQAQILDKIKKVKDDIAANTIDKLSRDPITTSFKDVDKTKHFENTYGDDAEFKSIFEQPFQPEQGYTLTPGFYEGKFQSFCIKAGTYMPTQGRGRFYAPIKGPKADIISHIIRTYQERSDLTHREVQLLLWAIIAKTDFAKMKGPVKATALKMLSAKQIARLSKGAIDRLTRNELKKVANQSDAVRAVLEAENNLRQKYYSGARTYQEYEQIAMRAGVEPIVPGWEAGRWTQHPDGYYIRYYPQGYRETTTQLYIPENMATVKFNPSTDVAVPPNRGQRLVQTSLPSYDPRTNTGGYQNNQEEDISCNVVVDTQIDYAVKQQMIMQNLPGLAIGVFRNGEIIHLKSYGYTNVVEKKKITNQTIMHWASISKTVTAVAAFQLERDPDITYSISDRVVEHCSYWPGTLDLCELYPDKCEDRVPRYLGDNRPGNITIENLLRNRSGIQHYGKGQGDRREVFYQPLNDNLPFLRIDSYEPDPDGYNAPSAVAIFKNSILDFAPDKGYLYSSFGFNLAGATIEEASPNGYVDWVMRNIAEVSNMDSFQVANKKDGNGNDAKREGHAMPVDGIFEVRNNGDKESVLPGGGWESNICDLAKFAIGLATHEYFDQADGPIKELWDASGGRYKYGVEADGSGSDLSVWHGGTHNNMKTLMQFYPSDVTGVVLMAPSEYAELEQLLLRIYKAIGVRDHLDPIKDATHTPMDLCRKGMMSGDDLFNALWRKTSKDVIMRTGRPDDEFFEEVGRLREAGYQCKDLEAFIHNGELYWDAVFQRDRLRKNLVVLNFTKQQFVDRCAEMRDQGYRLFDLETYFIENGKRRWAGVFRRTDDPYSVRLDRKISEFDQVRSQEQANGKKLIDIEIYIKGGQQYLNGVFTKGEPNRFNSNLSIQEFYNLVQSNRTDGYRLIDVEYYGVDPKEDADFKVAAIWEKSSVPERWRWLDDFCEIMEKQEDWSADGYELIDWNRLSVKSED